MSARTHIQLIITTDCAPLVDESVTAKSTSTDKQDFMSGAMSLLLQIENFSAFGELLQCVNITFPTQNIRSLLS